MKKAQAFSIIADNILDANLCKEVVMNILNATSVDTSLEDMFQRMGELLRNIAATRTGHISEGVDNAGQFTKLSEPGLGEKVDLSA
jgi:hypothetical protein